MFDLVQADSGDIGVLTMEGERSWEPLLELEAVEFGPAISPDGQWIAYVSNETGRNEVYVQRFPDHGGRQPISTEGGLDPTWSPDGQALFYLGIRGGGGPDEMAVVTIDPGPPLSVGNPEVLFDDAGYPRPPVVERDMFTQYREAYGPHPAVSPNAVGDAAGALERHLKEHHGVIFGPPAGTSPNAGNKLIPKAEVANPSMATRDRGGGVVYKVDQDEPHRWGRNPRGCGRGANS